MLSRNLPAWRYIVLVLSCAAAFGLVYFNSADYKKPLTRTQRVWNSICLWTLLLLFGIVETSAHFYSEPNMGDAGGVMDF